MSSFDVAIVGAGPAGSVTAYRLATAGASVLLLDKATFPRDKPCGGGVTGRAERLLPFSIEPVVEDVVDRLECGLRYRHRFTRRAHAPLAYMTQRRRLDHFLLRKAAEAGAEVREGETADARARDTRGYRLPLRLPGTRLARGRTAVIGDAAGLVDPFSGDGMYEAFLSAQLVTEAALEVLAGRADNLDAYQVAVERRITPLTRAGWGAKRAFERFPRTTYALARLPVTFRALEKLLQGDLPEPGAARGVEHAAIRAIYALSRAAAVSRSCRSAASS